MARAPFLKEFFLSDRPVGAVAPASAGLRKCVVAAAGVSTAGSIVELGPGSGTFTQDILRSRASGAAYLGVEVNGTLVQTLQHRFPDLHFVHSGAEAFDFAAYCAEHGPIDAVISGLPWTSFGEELQCRILDNILPHLAAGGHFVTYSYYGFHLLANGRRFRKALSDRMRFVATSPVVWANLPPAFVYVATR
jgi:phospholipid N-methyltransferase